ncbi:unnamed protein product [Lampetra planeri]
MDTRKTIRTHEQGQGDDQEGPSQQGSDGEAEVVPTLQHPSRTPDTPLQLEDGLQDAHSRLAELLLAAASILAEITASGGGRTGSREENWRQAPAPCRNARIGAKISFPPRTLTLAPFSRLVR